MNRQTTLAKNHEQPREWLHIDAADQVPGRLAARIAVVLQGKHKPIYTPHHDVGDFVVVTNVDKMRFTGNKLDQKHVKRYTGHPGGLKLVSFRDMMASKPERLLEQMVRRMMPKNRLGRQQLKKLKAYRGGDHPHSAQQPVAMTV